MPALAYIRGRLYPIEKAYKIHVEDRGYQYADAVYESIRYEKGKIIRIYDHLERLKRSLNMLQISFEFNFEEMKLLLEKIAVKTGYDRVLLYLQISRGVARREHPFPPICIPELVITARKFKPIPAKTRKKGVKCITHPDERWDRVDIKTVNLLANVLARERARKKGVRDSILFREDLEVTEASSANLFMVKDGAIYTPPLNGILEGVTRKEVKEIALNLKINFYEEYIYLQDIFLADEVFLSGTSIDILPVVEIDGFKIGSGKPGKVFWKVYEELIKSRN